MEILFIWAAFAVITSAIASSRGRSGFAWFIWGAIFGLFALILVCALPSEKPIPVVVSRRLPVKKWR